MYDDFTVKHFQRPSIEGLAPEAAGLMEGLALLVLDRIEKGHTPTALRLPCRAFTRLTCVPRPHREGAEIVASAINVSVSCRDCPPPTNRLYLA